MKCRFCNSKLKTEFVNLGMQPPSNDYIKTENEYSTEKFFPLVTFVCDNCKLVQTLDFADSAELFRDDYAYFSSYSISWLEHSKEYTDKMIKKFNLNESSFVLELASNDGYMLQYFKEKNIPHLGIEPCKSVAQAAINKGIDTKIEFFTTELAKKLSYPKADLIIANNVLAHVPDINDFTEGVKISLKSKGTATFEFPHLLNLIELNQFDTIYHEHYSYLSLIFTKRLFESHSLEIYDVEELPFHGGSLRLYVGHKGDFKTTSNINKILDKEKKLKQIETYKAYREKVKSTKRKLLELLINLKKQGKTIVSYGAAAKGNTLFNYCGIRNDFIDYAVDLNPNKQNKLLPGVHITVKQVDEIKRTKPDYILITPWNLKEEIIRQLSDAKEWGCKFIIAIPEAQILE